MKYTMGELAELVGVSGPVHPEYTVSTLLTDSRSLTYPDESVFFALHTATNDGHRFIGDLLTRGVRNFVVERITDDAADYPDANFIVVPSVEQALQKIAAAHRARFDVPVIAITGSRGKTTLKEWLYRLLKDDCNVARSPRSFNSQIGVPLSLWELDGDTGLGIFEAGISQTGEMLRLNAMIHPTLAIITNIGEEHDEGFADRRAKCREKLALAQGADALIYCMDDAVLHEEAENCVNAPTKLIGWSVSCEDAPVKVAMTDAPQGGTVITCRYGGKTATVNLPYTDSASRENAVNALIVMMWLGRDSDVIASRMAALSPVDTRLNVTEGLNDCMLIHDAYTGDFNSLGPAFDFMQRRLTPGRTSTVIMGDMVHDRMDAGALYADIARLMHGKGVSRVVGIGEEIACLKEYYGDAFEHYGSLDEFMERVRPSDFNHELILVKSSPKVDFSHVIDMLEARQHQTVLEVNLDALVRNYNNFRSRLRPTTGIVAMVKASGYGAGSYELAKTLQSQGAAYLAVAVADEGVDLRKAGITMPVMVLNPRVGDYATLFANHLEPEIYSFDILDQIIEEGRRIGVTDYPVHIKLDTGMHRLGFIERDLPELIDRLHRQRVVKPRSVFSHLAAADCPELDSYTMMQFDIFARCTDILQSAFSHHIMRHILNSTGITRFPQYQYDMVRLGICLYGIPTLPDHSQGDLEPVSALYSSVIAIKEWPAGTTIGYGCRDTLNRDSRIATVPIGYADGLNRHLGNGHSSVVINGHRCPTVGNICMDICMIDVTGVPCKVGDKVEVFGKNITAMEVADILGTIPYEVLTSVSTRVKRVYYRE